MFFCRTVILDTVGPCRDDTCILRSVPLIRVYSVKRGRVLNRLTLPTIVQYQYNRQSVNPSTPQQQQNYGYAAPAGQNQYQYGQNKYQSNAEAERLALAAKEAEYKAMAEKKLRDDEARKRAAMITKKKSVTVTQKKFDPLELEGDDLDNFVDELISGKK